MPVIITFTPIQGPVRTLVRGSGCVLRPRRADISGGTHRQKLPLGSVRGVTHLDALCLHCGAHFVWVEEPDDGAAERLESGAREPDEPGETKAESPKSAPLPNFD